jgi:hypothetical protein
VWPFRSRRRTLPVIEDALEKPQTSGSSAAADAAGGMERAQRTLEAIFVLDPNSLKDLVAKATALSGRLEGLIAALGHGHMSLGTFSGSIDAAETYLKNTVGQSPDIILRRFTLGRELKWPALLAFADGMVDNQMIDQDTLRLSELYDLGAQGGKTGQALHEYVQQSLLAVGHISTTNQWSKLLSQLTYGTTLVFIEGGRDVLLLDTVKFTARPIQKSDAEPAIKGPQEAFNEVLLTHINQIRRRIRTAWLRFDSITVGSYTETTVLVAHIEGLTNPVLVDTIKHRIQAIKRDTVQQINEVAAYMSDSHSMFPVVRLTDRVDWVVRDLLRGKVAVIVDNDPFVATLPSVLMDFYQTSQDYVFTSWEATLVRIVRFAGLALGLYLMPVYIALSSVDPDLVPTKLILTVAGSRLGIPFPPITEVIIMWFIIEVLREAANRLPKELATTLGTVGAVVVGTPIVILTTPTYSPPTPADLSRTAEG